MERRTSDRRIDEIEEKVEALWEAIFGDKEKQIKGMKEKVDDIHERITKVDGIGSLLKWLIIIGGAITALKTGILK